MLCSSSVDTFTELVKNDVSVLSKSDNFSTFKYPNMTREEITALDELARNHDISIKPADKGDWVGVMDTSKYVNEALCQLAETDVYHILNRDPRWDFEKTISSNIEKGFQEGLIDSKLKEYLVVKKNPKTPELYLIPKIHKSLTDPPEDQSSPGEALYLATLPHF